MAESMRRRRLGVALAMALCAMVATTVARPGANAQTGPNDLFGDAFLYSNGVITNLGTLPGTIGSSANWINALGDVVGSATDGVSNRAFIWTAASGMVDLNSLLPAGSGWQLQEANAINDNHQVVGAGSNSSGAFRGFLMTLNPSGPASIVDIGTAPGGTYAEPLAINNVGQVVGRADTTLPANAGPNRAFLYSGGILTSLGALTGAPESSATDINNLGEIIGESDQALPPAFTVEHHVVQYTGNGIIDLGLGAGAAINDAGQIVGTNGACHAALFSGGTVTDLGLLPGGGTCSSAGSINQSGMIVGSALTAGNVAERAVMFSGGSVIDLLKLPGVATHVNNSGQVVGSMGTTGYTPPGDPVVSPTDPATGNTPAALSFSGVTQAGDTLLNVSSAGPPPPSGFSLSSPPKYFDLTTTATFAQVVVCITDAAVTAGTRLLHFGAGGVATDVTAPGSPNVATHTICSDPLTSISPFAIATTTVHDTSAPSTVATPTPAANAAGWNRAQVTVALLASDPDGSADVARIHYSATGAQPIAATVAPGASASVVITAEGVTTLSYYAEDLAANSETAKSLTLSIDRTPPAVTYTGNAGTYTVDQPVAVKCSASDPANANGTAGSGLAGSTCHDVAGPAYSFGLGSHRYTAAATDNASNTGSGSTSFTVTVTFGSLCTLTKLFAEGSDSFAALPLEQQARLDQIVNRLCQQLAQAASEGSPRARAHLIAGYQAALPALVRARLLTADQAASLLALSKSL